VTPQREHHQILRVVSPRFQRPVDRELGAVRDGQREAHLPFQRERDDVLHGGLGGHISTVLY